VQRGRAIRRFQDMNTLVWDTYPQPVTTVRVYFRYAAEELAAGSSVPALIAPDHHEAIVYEARREQHQLIREDGWPAISTNSDPAAWAQRQAVPGAVIGPDASDAGPTGHNAYEVVLDVSARTPAGGYAIGQQVTYRQGSAQYTVRSYEGYAISPAGPEGPTRCTALFNAIDAAWPSS